MYDDDDLVSIGYFLADGGGCAAVDTRATVYFSRAVVLELKLNI